MTINVSLSGEAIGIDERVFRCLLENSVAGTYRDYETALAKRTIAFADLLKLAAHGEIPYPLFFAPLPLVEAQVATKTQRLLQGISRETFQVGSRETVELRAIELIVKDLIRKQELLKHHDRTLRRNEIVGLLKRPGPTTESDAAKLMEAIGLSHAEMRECRTKERAHELFIDRLEAHQILVSRSVRNYMPQRLEGARFSGMTIRDSKVPYIFLTGGDHGDQQEPVGRATFTLALMAVLVARRIFQPVTWDAQSTGTGLGREYDIAGAMLMPASRMRELAPRTLDDIKRAADDFKVTPSAVAVRAMRLGHIDAGTAQEHLRELRVEFGKVVTPTGRKQIRPENAIRKYAGRELARRMLHALDSGAINPKEFCRSVCLNRLDVDQIGELRRALR